MENFREQYQTIIKSAALKIKGDIDRLPIPMEAKAMLLHLNLGMIAQMSDHGALVSILIKKGVLTKDEYQEEAIVSLSIEKSRLDSKSERLQQ